MTNYPKNYKTAAEAVEHNGNWTSFGTSDGEASEGVPHIWWCEDCFSFHLTTYHLLQAVEQGKPVLEVYSCDQDGNWEYENTIEFSQEDQWYRIQHSKSASMERHYLEWCSVEGLDPVDWLAITTHEEQFTTVWRVVYQDVSGVMRLLSAGRRDEQDPDTGLWTVYAKTGPKQVPEEARLTFGCESVHGDLSEELTLRAQLIQGILDFEGAELVSDDGETVVADIQVVNWKEPTGEAMREIVREKARAALAQLSPLKDGGYDFAADDRNYHEWKEG